MDRAALGENLMQERPDSQTELSGLEVLSATVFAVRQAQPEVSESFGNSSLYRQQYVRFQAL
jgi:hypothetical protein